MNDAAPEHRWVYRAEILNVVDGDTVDLIVDCGFYITRQERVRLLGVDAREVRGADRPWGIEDKAFVQGYLTDHALPERAWPLVVETQRDERDKYGRLLATVWVDGKRMSLNDALLLHISLGGPAQGTRPQMRAT